MTAEQTIARMQQELTRMQAYQRYLTLETSCISLNDDRGTWDAKRIADAIANIRGALAHMGA